MYEDVYSSNVIILSVTTPWDSAVFPNWVIAVSFVFKASQKFSVYLGFIIFLLEFLSRAVSSQFCLLH